MTYHQQVAQKMSQTKLVGSLSSYETILTALEQRFPHEEDLRLYVGSLEKMWRIVVPKFQFIENDESAKGPN